MVCACWTAGAEVNVTGWDRVRCGRFMETVHHKWTVVAQLKPASLSVVATFERRPHDELRK